MMIELEESLILHLSNQIYIAVEVIQLPTVIHVTGIVHMRSVHFVRGWRRVQGRDEHPEQRSFWNVCVSGWNHESIHPPGGGTCLRPDPVRTEDRLVRNDPGEDRSHDDRSVRHGGLSTILL